MNRLSQRVLATLAAFGVLLAPVAAQTQAPAAPAAPRKLISPQRGDANVEITKPDTKATGPEVITVILVKNISAPAKGSARKAASSTPAPMDAPAHGVLVTIIDLGLARMDAHDGTAAGVHWTPFDEEVFEGEGDYQFDVYRMMRTQRPASPPLNKD